MAIANSKYYQSQSRRSRRSRTNLEAVCPYNINKEEIIEGIFASNCRGCVNVGHKITKAK